MPAIRARPNLEAVSRCTLETPLGPMGIAASPRHVHAIWFFEQAHAPAPAHLMAWAECHAPEHTLLNRAASQLSDYFSGARRNFSLPLAPRGTAFQCRVWAEIEKIAWGTTRTYAALAVQAGSPNGARAAGAATGRNPIAIAIPCHRVLGTQGAMTGYAGGLDKKRWLLAHEGIAFA